MATDNISMISSIGSGGLFPIELSLRRDSDGGIMVDENGVPLKTWAPVKGDPDLVKNNLTSVLVTALGQRLREEAFGTKLEACLEEPNSYLLGVKVKKIVEDAVMAWEPRISSLNTKVEVNGPKMYVHIFFKINGQQNIEDLNFSFNPQI